MAASRLLHALKTGVLDLPEGRIAVFAPRAGEMLPLPPERVQVVSDLRPVHDWFAALGYECAREPSGEFAAALVILPRVRDLARGLVAQALSLGVPVLIDGDRPDGIDAMWHDLRALLPDVGNLPKAHGRLLWFGVGAPHPAPDALADWAEAARPRDMDGWRTVAGAFSADGPDPGSVALADALPPLAGQVADLGAGWGYLAARVLAVSPGVTGMHLIEADAAALDCARVNVTDPRAHFHWADAREVLPGAPFDVIVTNPPFHAGRAADPDLGRAFIAAAAGALAPQGTLWLVANRHLPYDAALAEAFQNVETLPGTPAFRIVRAARPRRRR